ncbi:hypothetical protein AB1L88_10350 [Tautonia sp. JC769]|uniref:hypothetical protein n=1 Tax=Tautonia sp. JC769 TaxID=3232135 RepID=UPI00345861B0
MMVVLIVPFLALASVGLLLSLVAHGCAWLGVPQPLGMATWGLHLGIFVVWLPALLASGQMTRGAKREDAWRVALRGCPAWMRWMTSAFFVYAFFNFLLFFAAMAPAGEQAAEGDMPPAVFRGFSGHWMAFYSAALAMLYSSWIISSRGEPGGLVKKPDGVLQEGVTKNPMMWDRDLDA